MFFIYCNTDLKKKLFIICVTWPPIDQFPDQCGGVCDELLINFSVVNFVWVGSFF